MLNATMTNSVIRAALMGDIVHSERAADPAWLHKTFNAVVDRGNGRRDGLDSPLTITLGDEFQALATSFVAAASIARDIRLELLELDVECRFAIGVARIDTPVNRDRAWNMMGPGLAATRERLNEKSATNLYRFVLPDDPLLETMIEASGATLTAIERGWSATQRRDIAALLRGEDVAGIARRRNVTVHNIYKVRASGDYDLYRLQWQAVGEALSVLDRRYHMPGAEQWSTRSFTLA